MWQAWRDVTERLERKARALKHIGRSSEQRELLRVKYALQAMYDQRWNSKRISYERWNYRHSLFPDRLPICGEPSRHPEMCKCKKEEKRA